MTGNDVHAREGLAGWAGLNGLLRGIAAGTIVGIPSIYTMELWWSGMTGQPYHLLVIFGVTLLLNMAVCYATAFYKTYGLVHATLEAIGSVALALLVAAVLLLLIESMPWPPAPLTLIQQSILAGMPTSLGVSFARSYLGGKSGQSADEIQRQVAEHDAGRLQLKQNLYGLAASMLGGFIYAGNVAATGEVIKIANRLGAAQQLALVVVSLWLSYLILVGAGLRKRVTYAYSLLQIPWIQAVVNYALALVVATGMLYLIGKGGTLQEPLLAIRNITTLGLVTTVGGATGRLFT